MRPIGPIFTALGLAIVLAIGSVEPWAHSGATGIVKQRMDAMSAMSKTMKSIAGMIKGQSPFEPELIPPGTDGLIRHALEIPTLFPDSEHSRDGATEALPAVWQRWSRFVALSRRLEQEARDLKAAAQSSDRTAITRQFTAIAKVCRDCHSDFRRPND